MSDLYKDPFPTPPPSGPQGGDSGYLADFMVHGGLDDKLHVEVAVREDGQVAVFHNRPFLEDLAWLEFDLGALRLDFMREDGSARDFGVPIPQKMARNMDNTARVFLVLMDEDTGQAVRGRYVPLIVHRPSAGA